VLYNLGRPIYSTFPQSSWAYDPNVERYDFDVNKAHDLFTQAGYAIDGKKLTKDGQQLTLKMLYPSASTTAEEVATVMQRQLSNLGIAMSPQAVEFQALQDTLQKEPFDYDLFIGAWAATLEPYYVYQIWSEQSHREFALEKRKPIFAQIQQLITNDAPYVFLYEDLAYTGINTRVGGIAVGKRGPYNMHLWYVAK